MMDPETKAQVARTMEIFAFIAPWKKTHTGTSHRETLECPICRGELRVAIAGRRGHTMGKCKTIGCVEWRE